MAKTVEASLRDPKKASRLGRGLSSLMSTPVPVAAPPTAAAESPEATAPESVGEAGGAAAAGFIRAAVDRIRPNRHQPRQHFDAEALQRLADSLRAEGMMQPVVVRGTEAEGYELIAGERRWRAAQLAGLAEVPALVRQLDDGQAAEWALIENLQREDLNPIERAEAFERLGGTFGLSHDQIAERVGLERSTVSNLLRLLRLAPAVREHVSRGTLSMGQARALASIEDPQSQTALAERCLREGWSVRQVESAVRAQQQPPTPAAAPPAVPRSAHLTDLERQIATQLKTKVKLKAGRKKGSGSLTIDFYSIDQFDALLTALGVSTE